MGNLGDPKAGNGGHFWSFWLNLYRASEGTGDNWDHNESLGGHLESIKTCGLNIIQICP